MQRRLNQKAFTLIELLLVVGIISILLGVVLLAINPAEQLLKARDTERLSMRKEMQRAIHQYMIQFNRVVSEGEFRKGNLDGARPLCKFGVTDDDSCINVDAVTPDYISDLPYDDREVCANYSGYKAYIDKDERPEIISMRLHEEGDLQYCLWDDLVGYWPFYENNGNTVGDISGTNSTGELYGNPSHPIGKYGNTIAFDGSSVYVNLGNPDELKITDDQSICMWLYPTSIASRKSIFEKAYGGEGTIIQETNGSLTYYYGTSGGNSNPSQGFASSANVVSADNWTHACIVRNLSEMSLNWYINGTQDTVGVASFAAAQAGSNEALIGGGTVGKYAGYIDEFRVYNRALSEGEITLLANGLID